MNNEGVNSTGLDYIPEFVPSRADHYYNAMIAKLTTERDEMKSAWQSAERRVEEAVRGLDYLNEIDDAWDAFGTAGNRGHLSLAEQISAQGVELDKAYDRIIELENELAVCRAR